jgi:hypothetical protein
MTCTGPETEARLIGPAFAGAVICPERDSSRIAPALSLTRTVIVLGTLMT